MSDTTTGREPLIENPDVKAIPVPSSHSALKNRLLLWVTLIPTAVALVGVLIFLARGSPWASSRANPEITLAFDGLHNCHTESCVNTPLMDDSDCGSTEATAWISVFMSAVTIGLALGSTPHRSLKEASIISLILMCGFAVLAMNLWDRCKQAAFSYSGIADFAPTIAFVWWFSSNIVSVNAAALIMCLQRRAIPTPSRPSSTPMTELDIRVERLYNNKARFDRLVTEGVIPLGKWAVIIQGQLAYLGDSEEDVLKGSSEDGYCHRAGDPEVVIRI